MDFDSHNPVVSAEENELEDDNQVLLGSVQEKKVKFQPDPPQNQRINHQTPQRFVPMQQQQQQYANQWNQPQPLQQQLPYNQHVQMPQQQQPYYPQIVQQPQFDMNTYEPQLQQHTVQFPPTEGISPRRIGRKRPLSSKFIIILVLHLIAIGASNLMYSFLFTFPFLLCLASSIIGLIAAKKKNISAHGCFIGISFVEIFIFGCLIVLAFPLWAGGFSNENDRYQNQNNSHVHVFVFIGYGLFVLAGALKIVAVTQSFKLIKMIKKEMSIQENIHISTNGTVPQPQYIHNPMNVQPQQYIPQQQLQFPQQFASQDISSAPIDEESQPSLDQLQNQFSNEVRLLSEMGFDNTERNLYLLHKNNGNIQSVVQDYIKNY